ncbi:hypothetical protein SLS64_011755 [Diaporthe eres]|uniref:Uncharacterized protein n=1 Tax=Diaporthe eres TaxID=83184 RepID=A0ABR1P2B9_DIAER
MRFVKSLIAAAGLATTVLDGVVGAPAGNTHPTPPDPTKPFPPPAHIATSMSATTTSYSGGGGLPHFSTHTPSVIVSGSSLSGTGECDPTPTMGAPGNSLPVESTVTLSDEGMPITTVSATPSVIVTRTPSRGVSEPRMSSNPISVTRADGVLYEQQGTDRIPDPIITRVASLDDRQMTEKMPGLDERQMTEKMPGLDERQMIEKMPGLDARQMTEKMPGLDQRQMTEKMPGLEERQLLPTSITARQLLPTSVTARGAQEANWVDPPVSEPATQDVEARQLLPTSITARNVQYQPIPAVGSHPNPNPYSDVEERQLLPTSITARDLPLSQPAAPIGAHPNPHPYSDVDARQLLPTSITARGVDGTPVVWPPGVGGPGPNPDFDARQILPTSTIGDEEPPVTTSAAATTTSTTTTTTMTAEATSCVGGCAVTSITTLDPRADTQATGHVEFAPASQAAESTVTATDLHTVTLQPPSTETTTVISTQLITITVPRSSDNCTSPTITMSETTIGTSAPFPPTNGTLTITLAPTSSSESEDVTETSTSTSTSTSSTETTSSTTETTTSSSSSSSSSSSVTSSVTTITTTLDYSCSHESCGPATQTLTKTLDPSSSPPSTSATTTTTAGAVGGSTTGTSSTDTCTESTTTSSTSAEETTLTTVTTHSTTTLTGTAEQGGAGDDDRTVTMDVTVVTPTLGQGPPRLTPPAITQRDEEDRAGTTVVEAITTTVITPTTTTIDQGPPRLTPPPITRRDDGPPEVGPIDAPPHVTDKTFTVIPPLSRSSIIVGPPMPPRPEFSPSWSSVRPDLPYTAGGQQDRHHHPTPTFIKTTLETSVVPTAA